MNENGTYSWTPPQANPAHHKNRLQLGSEVLALTQRHPQCRTRYVPLHGFFLLLECKMIVAHKHAIVNRNQ